MNVSHTYRTLKFLSPTRISLSHSKEWRHLHTSSTPATATATRTQSYSFTAAIAPTMSSPTSFSKARLRSRQASHAPCATSSPPSAGSSRPRRFCAPHASTPTCRSGSTCGPSRTPPSRAKFSTRACAGASRPSWTWWLARKRSSKAARGASSWPASVRASLPWLRPSSLGPAGGRALLGL